MASREEIGFPDAPRSELERTIEELVERAQRVLDTQGRLRSLLRANRIIVEDLDIEGVLRRVVETALDLVDARYGALGVIGSDGYLERFIHVGISDAQAELIGHLPRGTGVLGAVIQDGVPIRLEHLSDDPRSSGFPEHHPPMDAFLGVPIRVRDRVFGNLYLTEPAAGVFTQEDEEVVGVLAASAGIAIDNARLFDEARTRERWAAALADVTSALLSAGVDALAVVVEHIAVLVDADLATVVVPAEGGEVMVPVARGTNANRVQGHRYPAEGSLAGAAIASGKPVLADSREADAQYAGQPELGPTLVVPLSAGGETIGALMVSRPVGGEHFSDIEIDRASAFAAQASVAVQIARGRADREQLERVEDRSRIARDLHDHVIQRLFAVGLGLQAEAARSGGSTQRAILEQVDAIDAAIREIRTIVFALSSPDRRAPDALRHRILDVVAEAGSALAEESPRLSFTGAVDLLVPVALFDDIVAVVREALANVARHAGASATSVEIIVDGESVTVVVVDDGVGYRPGKRASGIANLAARAETRHGTFDIRAGDTGGTVVRWSVPLEEAS